MSGIPITDNELVAVERMALANPGWAHHFKVDSLIATLRTSREQYGNAVEAMRLCMKDLQEHGVIFAPGDPPYDILVEYDKEVES